MKTNIANGTFILGTVYSHDNGLVIGDQKKGMAFNLPLPEGLHRIIAMTNEYGEVISINIDLKHNVLLEQQTMVIREVSVMVGNHLDALTPDQQLKQSDIQVDKCKKLINAIKMDGISLLPVNMEGHINTLCKELRLKRHEVFDLFVCIFEELVCTNEAETVLKCKFEDLMSYLSVNGGFEGDVNHA